MNIGFWAVSCEETFTELGCLCVKNNIKDANYQVLNYLGILSIGI